MERFDPLLVSLRHIGLADGGLWSWGYGDDGKLAHGDDVTSHEPRPHCALSLCSLRGGGNGTVVHCLRGVVPCACASLCPDIAPPTRCQGDHFFLHKRQTGHSCRTGPEPFSPPRRQLHPDTRCDVGAHSCSSSKGAPNRGSTCVEATPRGNWASTGVLCNIPLSRSQCQTKIRSAASQLATSAVLLSRQVCRLFGLRN